MKTLIVNKNGSIEVKEISKPNYSEKQALVKTISCGICNGTDAKLIHQKFKGYGEENYPLMLGHEGVGEVIEIGSKVTSFHVGDKVLLPFVNADPQNNKGLDSAWGAFSEYGVVDDAAAYEPGAAPECAFGQSVLPDWVNPVEGAMIITLREVLSSIKRFGIKANNSVLIFGCGPVGLTFIKFLKLLGVNPIIAMDIIDGKLEEAIENGADYAYNSKRVDAGEIVQGICPKGVQFAIDAVGIPSIINQSMELICDGGKICCYGISPTCNMELDWSKAPYNWQLQFQQFPSKIEEGACHEQILEWLKDGTVDLKDYISDYFAFSDILEAFRQLEQRNIRKKGIVVYEN